MSFMDELLRCPEDLREDVILLEEGYLETRKTNLAAEAYVKMQILDSEGDSIFCEEDEEKKKGITEKAKALVKKAWDKIVELFEKVKAFITGKKMKSALDSIPENAKIEVPKSTKTLLGSVKATIKRAKQWIADHAKEITIAIVSLTALCVVVLGSITYIKKWKSEMEGRQCIEMSKGQFVALTKESTDALNDLGLVLNGMSKADALTTLRSEKDTLKLHTMKAFDEAMHKSRTDPKFNMDAFKNSDEVKSIISKAKALTNVEFEVNDIPEGTESKLVYVRSGISQIINFLGSAPTKLMIGIKGGEK